MYIENFIMGLIGAPNSGKDLIADYLVKNKDFTRLAFADKIKNEFFTQIGITEEFFKSIRGTIEERQIRDAMWAYSIDRCKKFGKLYFINDVIWEIGNSQKNIIITDIRTKDELDETRKAKAQIFVIIRDFYSNLSIDGIFPGTRLSISDIIGLPVFFNYSNNIEVLHKDIESLYNIVYKHNKGDCKDGSR